MCLSHSCTLLKPLDGMRCRLAEILVWSQVTLSRSPTGRGDIWGWNPQFATMPPIAKLLCPLLSVTSVLLFCVSEKASRPYIV